MKRIYRVLISCSLGLTIIGSCFGCSKTAEPQLTTIQSGFDSAQEADVINETDDNTIDTEEVSSFDEVLSEEEFITTIEDGIVRYLGVRDNVNEISLENRELYIQISLERNNNTLSRYTSVTDYILSITDGYDLWDTIIIDFGSQGYIIKTKDDIVSDENGNHFSVCDSDLIAEV